VAERRGRCERAPVRLRKGGERQPETRLPTRFGEARVELGSRAQEQDRTLEAGELRDAGERLQRGLELERPHRRFRGRLARDARAHLGERGDEVRLVRGAPVGGLGGYGITTVGSSKRLVVVSTCSGLSAPSTWMRTRYVPAATPATAKDAVPESASIGAAGKL